MLYIDEDSVKQDVTEFINECVEAYTSTRNKEYLYKLLDFLYWLNEIQKSIVEILQSYNIPIEVKGSKRIEEIYAPTYLHGRRLPTPELKAEPIVIEIPKIELKLPEEVETVTAKTSKYSSELTSEETEEEYSEEEETELTE